MCRWPCSLAILLLPLLAGTAQAAEAFSRVDLRQVQLGGLLSQRANLTVQNNLLRLEVDRDFLRPFREKKAEEGFTGLGMLIDAAVRFAAHLGSPRVVELKTRLVREAIAAQESDGYLGMLAPPARMWRLWDIHEMGYLVYGLVADYQFFGEKASLEAARRLADYLLRRWPERPDWDAGGLTVHMAVTGLERTMLTLSDVTGQPKYREFCLHQRQLAQWDMPIVIGRWGKIEGHAYAYFAHALAQLHLYRQQPDPKLLQTTRRAMDFLLRRDGLVITGSCGDHECWHDTQAGTTNLAETCATAYLIRLMDDLLRLEGDGRYGDIMERVIYNALLAAQSPDGRRIRYYTPFDGPRQYFSQDSYCCPNNFRRIIAELPGLVYYRAGSGGVLINLYTASQVKLATPGGEIRIRQETDYPNSGRVTIHVEPAKPGDFTVHLRIPGWCTGPKVAVNGKAVELPEGLRRPGGRPRPLLAITRTWQPGDRIELEFPMPWRWVRGRKAQSGRVALMRGPLLFCLNRARHKELEKIEPRMLTIAPETLEGPVGDSTVRPDGLAAKVRAWRPGAWYPHAKPDFELVLTEYPDPAGEAVYFHVPNPHAKEFVEDELLKP